ncbi:FecR domain-containing protein [Pseudomonas sp. NPDC007930]|uniref:FecR domain-containing protein n=1 Tax=Pseudomonas sp. NPDC007930 TaxID=3364417 RepID=UPI0036E34F9F
MLSPEVARAAARWQVLVESGGASERDLAALQRWRAASEAHEQAWHALQRLHGRFEGLPAPLAMASLDRPEAGRRQLLKGMLGLAVAAPAAWVAWRELPLAAWRADYSTGTGERRRVVLADGSLLQLNTASAVNVRAQQLRLLRGEIALRLGAAAPWRVDTALGRATLASGELCVREDASGCEFALLSGQALIEAGGQNRLALSAGQRVRLEAGGFGPVSLFDTRQPGWRDGVIVALNQPLGDFLRDLDRYRPGLLRWAPELEPLRVTGSFRLDNTDQVLELLAASLPLRVQWRTRYWATLLPA